MLNLFQFHVIKNNIQIKKSINRIQNVSPSSVIGEKGKQANVIRRMKRIPTQTEINHLSNEEKGKFCRRIKKEIY
jgi:hypothetical protein